MKHLPQRATLNIMAVNRCDNAEVNYENQPSEKDLHTDRDRHWGLNKQQLCQAEENAQYR